MSVLTQEYTQVRDALYQQEGVPKMIETEYGWVNLERYSRLLSKEEVAEMISDIRDIPSFGTQKDIPLLPFFQKWNLREIRTKYPDVLTANAPHCNLLAEAVKTGHVELIRFVCKRLVYDDRFYSLARVDISSIRLQKVADLLTKYTLHFGADYEEVTEIREKLWSMHEALQL